MLIYLFIGIANLLALVSVIFAVIDSFKSKKIIWGIVLILLPVSVLFYFSEFNSQERKKISKYFLLSGVIIGFITIGFSVYQDIQWLKSKP